MVGGVAAKSDDLSDGQMITTLNGDSVTVKLEGGNVYIDNAMVTVANLVADNGVVHMINADLISEAPTAIRANRLANFKVDIYPNPSSEFFNVSFDLKSEAPLTIGLYDLQAKLYRSRNLNGGYVGTQTEQFSVVDMDPGMYVLIIQTPVDRIAKKVKIIK